MKFSILLAGALFLFLSEFLQVRVADDPSFESVKFQTATISGTVTLPSAPSSTRSFRGSAYRNRGSVASPEENESTSNRFTETIISAHPTSFEITHLPTSDSVLIIQKNAEFIPSVTPVTVGSTVYFVNNDSFYHNVFSLTPGAKFNIGRRPTGDIYAKEIPPTKWKVVGLGPIDLFCDIHSQMNAVILSLDTPYFTRVNEDGAYKLSGLPPGTYQLRVYNKDLDLHTQKTTVAADEQYEINFNLIN